MTLPLSVVKYREPQGVVAGVMNSCSEIESYKLIFNQTNHSNTGAKAIAFNSLQPDTPDRASIGLIPDTTPLINVRLLFSPCKVRIHRVLDSHSETIDCCKERIVQFI